MCISHEKYQAKDENDGIHLCSNFTVSLNFLHLVIILRQEKILKCLLEEHKTSVDNWTEKVVVTSNSKNVIEDDSWIFEANCLHFAAKFYPKGLHILLTHFKQSIIKITHAKEGKSPLHVAASTHDSLNTR